MLAEMVGTIDYAKTGVKDPTVVHPIIPKSSDSNIVAGYQEGVGLNQTFLEYIWNGATAMTIGDECTSMYKFIVEHFDNHEIWMFGFSRGAFTVRSVVGMINNCGIINKDNLGPDQDLALLCDEVYRTYRSPLDVDHPNSDRCRNFRKSPFVWQIDQPVKFMGLIDTVGGLGIPTLNAGVGISWPETQFHDQTCSSVVQTVYHAPALHDRLWIFQPCLIFPKKENGGRTKIVQQWFPGCHYDVGRQAFRFLRNRPWNPIERWLGVLPNLLSKTIWPNEVLADLVLRWLLCGVRDTSTSGTENAIFTDIQGKIDKLTEKMAKPPRGSTGSGDVYTDLITSAGPLGHITGPLQQLISIPFKVLDYVFPRFGTDVVDLLGVKTVIRALTGLRDRRVPRATSRESVYAYHDTEDVLDAQGRVTGRFSVAHNAEMGKSRYPSRTFEAFEDRRGVFGW